MKLLTRFRSEFSTQAIPAKPEKKPSKIALTFLPPKKEVSNPSLKISLR